MLVQHPYALESMAEVRELIQTHGWALLVCAREGELHAAHVPCLLDPQRDPGGERDDLVVIGHAAQRDPAAGALRGGGEVLLVFQGEHGYVSPAWYGEGAYVPTWNFVAAHLYGRPELLEGEEGFEVLARTVEHFEAARDHPWRLEGPALAYARAIAPQTVPFRLRPSRIEAKAKLSQDKPRAVQERVVDALERPGPYRQPQLAREMRRLLRIGNR
jgi:transcriptional regulator